MQYASSLDKKDLYQCHQSEPLFDQIRLFASKRYEDQHHARIRHFLPTQFLLTQKEQWLASCGLRHADHEALFLEQYLDAPIEAYLTDLEHPLIERSQIVELGNLAGFGGSTRLIILALTRLLAQQHTEYVAFTATRAVRASFQRLGIPLTHIAHADAERLGSAANQWGSYYDNQPEVLVGDVQAAWRSINQHPFLVHLLNSVAMEEHYALSGTL